MFRASTADGSPRYVSAVLVPSPSAQAAAHARANACRRAESAAADAPRPALTSNSTNKPSSSSSSSSSAAPAAVADSSSNSTAAVSCSVPRQADKATMASCTAAMTYCDTSLGSTGSDASVADSLLTAVPTRLTARTKCTAR